MKKKSIICIIGIFFLLSISFSSTGNFFINTKAISIQSGELINKADENDNNLIILQSPTWIKKFGGGLDDLATCVQQTSDGGFIISGIKDFNSLFWVGGDIWLIKIDIFGNIQWEKTFGDKNVDFGEAVQQTNDGGYIIAGSTWEGENHKNDIWLIKTDSSGNLEWDKKFHQSDDEPKAVQQTLDGGYIIFGNLIIKTDSNGNEIWRKDINCEHGQQTADGGYIVTGTGGYKIILIKMDSLGNIEWNYNWGGLVWCWGFCVQQTTDGGYIISGSGHPSERVFDTWLIKTDENGIEEWNKTYDGGYYDEDQGIFVQQTTDGGYIVTGRTTSSNGNWDLFLLKTDANGNKKWEKKWGEKFDDVGWSVRQTSDGGFIIAGWTTNFLLNMDAWLIKTDKDGKCRSLSLNKENIFNFLLSSQGNVFQRFLKNIMNFF